MQAISKVNNKRSKPCEPFWRNMPMENPTSSNTLEDSVPFSVEDIVQSPLPGYVLPTSVCFSPDDSVIAYLFSPDQTLSKTVYAVNVKNGIQELAFNPPDGGLDESNISPEEKLRRERSRERGLGVTRFEWINTNSKKKMIMVPVPTGIYFQDLSLSKSELVLASTASSPIIDPHLSPDGRMVSYVRDAEVHVVDLSQNIHRQLTHGAENGSLMHGIAEYIAQEEMDRKNGYWWSPDSKYIAFTEVDSKGIPLFRIMHQGKSFTGESAQEDHAYPFAGASNLKVRLGVVPVYGGPVVWMDLACGGAGEHDPEHEYLARVNWMRGNVLTAQVLNRTQSELKIYRFDIKTGQRHVLLTEQNKTWINLHDMFTPLDKGVSKYSESFIWANETTGFRHLYLYDSCGNCLAPITQGEWMVEQIAGVNESTGVVYFTATIDGSLGSNLYVTKLYSENSSLQEPVRLTKGEGKHTVVLDHHLQNFVDVHDSLDCPPKVMLCSLLDGRLIMPLFEQSSISIFKQLELKPPEIVQIPAIDGTILNAAIYKPDPVKFGPPPYKTLISVYGGPCVQIVTDSWANTVDLRAQYLRNRGILVWKLDNRGTARRGLKFEGALKHKAGTVDAEDQHAGAQWLIKQGLAAQGHIGLYGWSYGGYMSAMILAKYPEVFNCAVSGAPVTSWDGYDTFYTEKYMGLPSENSEGYETSSVMHHVHKLKGRLLLVHGMIDENVHFRHTARLINSLIAAGKPYEILLFPDERHMPRRLRDRVYIEERIWDFFERNL